MKIAVITDETLKQELLAPGVQEGIEWVWLTEPVPVEGADAYIDLLFSYDDTSRTDVFKNTTGKPVFINCTDSTLEGFPVNFTRFNGWNSFLKRTVMEISCTDEQIKPAAERIIAALGRTAEWVPDIPGFIAARVVCMIINEAYMALEEKVSSRDDIDTAMKLGTNYPYGPFEWAGIIGLKKVNALLSKLAEKEPRYTPSPLLQKEARSS